MFSIFNIRDSLLDLIEKHRARCADISDKTHKRTAPTITAAYPLKGSTSTWEPRARPPARASDAARAVQRTLATAATDGEPRGQTTFFR